MEEYKVLQEINQSAKTGMDGLNYIFEKVKDNEFKNLLYRQQNEYQNIYNRSKEILLQQDKQEKDTPVFQKVMSWMGIQLNTLDNQTSSKIAEILIQGNEMGIVKGTKILNNLQFSNQEIENLLKDFIHLQEENMETLKQYL